MTQAANYQLSPLEQTRRHHTVLLDDPARRLSVRDEMTLRQILASKCDFVHNPIFGKKNAEKKIFDEAPAISKPDTKWYHPVMEMAREQVGSRSTGATVLLTAVEERALFLQFNYCRYRVAKLCKQIASSHDTMIDADVARELLAMYRRAEAYRGQIANTNLGLVLAMAKRTRMTDVDFGELVSEGNMALLRAADKFDVAHGFKFSTYACRAILKAFSRAGVKLSKYRQLFHADFDSNLERSNFADLKRLAHESDCIDVICQIINENRAELTDIEQSVIEHRFGVRQNRCKDQEADPLTLGQVGEIFGVTKERVRQIQNKAMSKIRNSLERDFLN